MSVATDAPTGAAIRTRINWPMRVTAVGVALLALVGIVAGSHVRLRAFEGDHAVVRMAWSARPERIERCRRLSDGEMARLPVHMRQRLECEGTTARYRLEARRDGVLIDSATVRGGGLRHDRELYVSRELLIPPGASRITVQFVRIDSPTAAGVIGGTDGPDDEPRARSTPDALQRPDTTRGPLLADRSVREDDERRRRRAEAIPAVLSLDTVVTLASRSVILVTYDPLVRRLITKVGAP